VVDGLAVEDYCGLLLGFEAGEVEESAFEGDHELVLEAADAGKVLPAEESVETVGPVTGEVYDPQETLLADRDQPITSFRTDFLQVGDSLAVVADACVDVLKGVSGKEDD
jgi:hypothetical protein